MTALVPTPMDIARRAVSPPPATPTAPARPFRDVYEQGIRQSGLNPNSRLVALTLATYADRITGAIPAARQPGLNRLARATGLSNLSTRDALRELQQVCWIDRPSGPRQGRAGQVPSTLPVRLTIPPYARARLGL